MLAAFHKPVPQRPLSLRQGLLEEVRLRGEPTQVSRHSGGEPSRRRVGLRHREDIGRDLARGELEDEEASPQALAGRDVLPRRYDQTAR